MAKKDKSVAEEKKGPRQFTPEEVLELQELQRFSQGFLFIAKQIQGNTALIPGGKDIGAQFDAIGRLLANTKQHWIEQKLRECGYSPEEKVSIDFRSGIIISDSAIEESLKQQGKKTK